MNEQKIGVPLEGFSEFSRKVSAEGAVLLKNLNQALPLRPGEHIALFGRTQVNYYRSGTGSGGSVNVAYTTNLLDSLSEGHSAVINETVAKAYEDWIKDNPFDNGGNVWAGEPWHQKEMPLAASFVEAAAAESQKAVVVIGRTAGEDKDNAGVEGSYLLTAAELDMLKKVCAQFDCVIVVLNVSNIIDMSWLQDPDCASSIQAVLYTWQGGMEGGRAAADVLTGKVTVSGKLTDTIAYALEDYPSSADYGGKERNYYKEDIYVGYRYFETFCPEKVMFPFGFGLSYTTFSLRAETGRLVNKDGEDRLSFDVSVTNTGSAYSGREVVELYCEAPQGVLGKPARVLAAFSKTKLLACNEEQTLTLTVKVKDLASYDDSGATGHRSCYVLESGDYHFYIGTSIRDAAPVQICGSSAWTLPELLVTEKLQEALAPTEHFTRITPGSRLQDGTYSLTYTDVPRQTISLSDRIKQNLPEVIPQTGSRGITLHDAADGKASLDDFIAQLDAEELAALVRGEGMCSPLVTPGTASAFGGISDSLFAYGIPVGCTADGPSGIRMDNGGKATQLPIGTLLAASWDPELIEELYIMEGRELLRNEVDALLGPGLNIRRNPLNGRNFEYFSEDPLISGRFASAIIRGITKGGSNATLKHFACNNQESSRSLVDAAVSERALREIYLKGFELAVKEGGANCIMTSYNPINGHWAASNYDLNTTVLRGEWGFTGIVMTDWWAKMNDPVSGGAAHMKNTAFMIRAQNDLYMVINNGGAEVNSAGDTTLSSLADGTLTLGELQRNAKNICRFLIKAPVFSRRQERTDTAVSVAPRECTASAGITGEAPAVHILDTATASCRFIPADDECSMIEIRQSGLYSVNVQFSAADSGLAQMACNLYLNDKCIATLQAGVTFGLKLTQKLAKTDLETGIYELRLEHVKPGLKIEWLELKHAKH